ncbi:MAG: hypothetical protein QNI91_16825 [Arenicellales bacterium]|nr:hypothetical protein [Arenicellales bacterium]
MCLYYPQNINGAMHQVSSGERTMAYDLMIKMGACYVGAITVLTAVVTILA